MTMTYALKTCLRAFRKNRSGATAIEYGLIAALLAVAIIGSYQLLGNRTSAMFNYVSDTAGGAIGNAATSTN
jgi:pilus assembly protein Flp/PilA